MAMKMMDHLAGRNRHAVLAQPCLDGTDRFGRGCSESVDGIEAEVVPVPRALRI
jgi:hypothetical protein